MYNWNTLWSNTADTIEMLLISAVFVVILGLLIGIALFYTSPSINHSKSKLINYLHIGISSFNNALRSIPFIVLLVIMIPFTVLIVGTMLGVAGAIPPLIISATPFFAQVVYNALIEVDKGTVEACRAMGASPLRMLLVVVRECLSSLIRGVAMTLITLVSFISVAGVVGAGGLGQFAINAQYKHQTLFVWMAVINILLIIFVIYLVCEIFARILNHNKQH